MKIEITIRTRDGWAFVSSVEPRDTDDLECLPDGIFCLGEKIDFSYDRKYFYINGKKLGELISFSWDGIRSDDLYSRCTIEINL
jgi:hypothetical protein